MTYQSDISTTIDTLQSCLQDKLSPEERRNLDKGRTDPDALWDAITGPDGILMKAFTQLSDDADKLTKCLAIYVTAADRLRDAVRIDIGIPYRIAAEARRLTEEERRRFAKDQA